MGWRYHYVLLLDPVDLKQFATNAEPLGFKDITNTARKVSQWIWDHKDEYSAYTKAHAPTPIGEKSSLPEEERKAASEWYHNWLKAKPTEPEVLALYEDDNKPLADGPLSYRLWLRKIKGATTLWWTEPYWCFSNDYQQLMFAVILASKYRGRLWYVSGQSESDQVTIYKYLCKKDGTVRRFNSTESSEGGYECYMKRNQPTWDIHEQLMGYERLPLEDHIMLEICKTIEITSRKRSPVITKKSDDGQQ